MPRHNVPKICLSILFAVYNAQADQQHQEFQTNSIFNFFFNHSLTQFCFQFRRIPYPVAQKMGQRCAMPATAPGKIHRFTAITSKKTGFNNAENVFADAICKCVEYFYFLQGIDQFRSMRYTEFHRHHSFIVFVVCVVTPVYTILGMMSFRHFNKFALL